MQDLRNLHVHIHTYRYIIQGCPPLEVCGILELFVLERQCDPITTTITQKQAPNHQIPNNTQYIAFNN